MTLERSSGAVELSGSCWLRRRKLLALNRSWQMQRLREMHS